MITYRRKPLHRNAAYFLRRSLELGTKVSVKVGDVVYPEDVIARGLKRSGYRVFNLAEIFRVGVDRTRNTLRKTIGSRVYKGDEVAVLAQWWGLKEKVFRSPVNGTLTDYNLETSRITVEYSPSEVRLTSGVFGKVVRLVPGDEMIIATRVDVVRGVIGFGTNREGSLIEVGYPDVPIQPNHLLPRHANKIIFGGTKIGLDSLYKALSIGVGVVVTGGMDYSDFIRLIGSAGRLENIGISVILTEGFGSLPIYPPIYDFLKESEHRFGIFRPGENSLFIPVSSELLTNDQLPEKKPNLSRSMTKVNFGLVREGTKVRVISERDFGAYGIVSKIDDQRSEVEVTTVRSRVNIQPQFLEIIQD